MNVGIYVFDEVELLDMAGPYEVFTTASRLHARTQAKESLPLFTVTAIASALNVVRARAGLGLSPDCTLRNHPRLDCAIIPGGVVDAELCNGELMTWIAQQAGTVRVLASVCTGTFLLAKAGVLGSHQVTTHWEDAAALRELWPQLSVCEGHRWVDSGAIVTSAGISAGIDMSLHLVARLHSRELAILTAKQLEFDWTQAV